MPLKIKSKQTERERDQTIEDDQLIRIGFSENRDLRVFRGFETDGNSKPSQHVPEAEDSQNEKKI